MIDSYASGDPVSKPRIIKFHIPIFEKLSYLGTGLTDEITKKMEDFERNRSQRNTT